jgi:hypothetical protein
MTDDPKIEHADRRSVRDPHMRKANDAAQDLVHWIAVSDEGHSMTPALNRTCSYPLHWMNWKYA